ncbi:MAG: hypothetical protein ACJ77H_13670, partial [Actinomycetota bacterium]
DYLELVFRKTCWYTTVWPLRVGALVAHLAAVQFGQGVAAAYEAFSEAFADVPPSPHRDFVEAIVPYMPERPA